MVTREGRDDSGENMKRSVSAVIGANFGDEGKGLVTDFLADQGTKPLVVRFNGGAQAGHTVVTPDGRRHVFHHFGSGSFAGASTFLSKFFAVSPMFFGKELKALGALGVVPSVYVDPGAPVTTPYDIMLNQAAEKARGNKRHGSCGMGFAETIHREVDVLHSLYFGEIEDESVLRAKLNRIRFDWVPMRAGQLGISEKIEFLNDERIFERFVADCKFTYAMTRARFWRTMRWEGDLIFEGAQGLRLDMFHENFPHVTRSQTGVRNVKALLAENVMGASVHEKPDVFYATRTYLTRHGAGPLNHELPQPPYEGIVDETNVPNEHQGALRFALLDFNELVYELEGDIGPSINPCVALTCADQCDEVRFIEFGEEKTLDPVDFAEKLAAAINAKKILISFGNTRETVKLGDYDARPDTQTTANKPAVDHQVQSGL